MTWAGRARACAGAAMMLLASCSAASNTLLVDVRTDLQPGVDFAAVRVELIEAGRFATTPAAHGDDYASGARVAEFDTLAAGTHTLRVLLQTASGVAVLERPVRVSVSGTVVITVLMTRSCVGIACGTQACQGGVCVDPQCSSLSPASCATTCASESACATGASCAAPLCIDGACLLVGGPTACPSGQYCDPHEGCLALPSGAGTDAGARDASTLDDASFLDAALGLDDAGTLDDAGMLDDAGTLDDATVPTDATNDASTCAATESNCTDGIDEDCDGDVDCADADCLGNACDDGSWCDGADQCGADGTCSVHPAPACPAQCSETLHACVACLMDSDCGATTYGSWGTCGGFSSTCDTSGTQSRTVTTHTCLTGACHTSSASQSQACTRSTTGNTCATTTYSSWSACGGFTDVCDTSGTQTRTVTTHTCASGSCGSHGATQSQGCTRSTNGVSCGRSGCPDVCASGVCDYRCASGCPC